MLRDKSKIIDKMHLEVGKAFKDEFKPNCNVKIQLWDKDGNLKQEEQVHNAVTDAGVAGLWDQALASPTLAKVGWMAIGTGSPASTLLGTEVARVAFATKTRSAKVITVTATFGAGVGTGAITEAGTFDVVTANTVNMWMSASFSVINKGATDVITITWTLTGTN